MPKQKNTTNKSIDVVSLMKDSVASVGTFKPKFSPQAGKVFSDELNILGTAFWVSDKNVLVTCAHVVAEVLQSPVELAGLLVIGYKGSFYRSVVSIIDHQHDLAVLSVIDPIQKTNVGLEITKSYPKVSTKVSWAGYPLGNLLLNQIHEPTYNEGVIGIEKRDENNRKVILISGTVVGGYSGSPVVLTENGKVVGVVSNGPQNAGIFMAVSYEHLTAICNLATS
jgi:hypothetical protein